MIAFLAWVIFSEISILDWLGGTIIFSSTVYITRREAKIKNSIVIND